MEELLNSCQLSFEKSTAQLFQEIFAKSKKIIEEYQEKIHFLEMDKNANEEAIFKLKEQFTSLEIF